MRELDLAEVESVSGGLVDAWASKYPWLLDGNSGGSGYNSLLSHRPTTN